MKKTIANLSLLLLIIQTVVLPVSAQTNLSEISTPGYTGAGSSAVMPIRDPNYPLPQPALGLPGQDHYYTLQFRGNGEALVSLKVIFTNETGISTNQFQLHGFETVNPSDITAYQVTARETCTRWIYPNTPIPMDSTLEKGVSTKPVTPVITMTPLPQMGSDYSVNGFYPAKQYCAQYGDADITPYMSGNALYQRANVLLNGGTATVDLMSPVEGGKTGAVVLTYRTFAYAHKTIFGAYDYTFTTLKSDAVIRQAQVGVNIDPDLKLRGVQSGINYAQGITVAPAMKMLELDRVNVSAPEFDTFYNQIGSGMILKQANQLQPEESYTMKGIYAPTTLQLYANDIFLWVIIIAAICLLGLFTIRFAIIRLRQRENQLADVPRPHHSQSVSFSNIPSWVIAISVGFGSAVFLLIYSLFIIFVMSLLQNIYSPFTSLISVLLALISFSIYAFVLFVPAGLVWWRRGWKFGLLTCAVSIACLFVCLMISVAVIIAMGNQQPVIMPMKY